MSEATVTAATRLEEGLQGSPEQLFRYGSWVFFTLLVAGFAFAAITGDASVAGPFLILAGLPQAALNLALVLDHGGIRSRLRRSDYSARHLLRRQPVLGQVGN